MGGMSKEEARQILRQYGVKHAEKNPTNPATLDAFTKKHLTTWLDMAYLYGADKRHAKKIILAMLKREPSLLAEGKSWPEILRMGESAGINPRNPHELLIMGANPRVEVVHGENPPVEDIHAEFTGQEVKWIDVYNEPHMPAGRYAELGPLIALYVKPEKGGPVLRIGAPENHEDFAEWWDKKPPIIVTDSTARQIYFVDGCQDLSNLFEQFGADEEQPNRFILGQVRRIDYECRKEHVAHPDEDRWKHDHGEEDGQLPTLLFDARHKRMLYQGGNYRIEGPWIKN